MSGNGMNQVNMDQAVKLCLEGERLCAEDRRSLAARRLKELVSYVRERSSYFREAYKGLGDEFGLEELPFTTKEMLIKDYRRWLTDPEITHQGVMDYIEDPSSLGTLYLGKYTAITTSGTTGSPMPFVRDAGHNTIHGALMQTRLLRDTDPDILLPLRHKIASLIFLKPSVSSYSGLLKLKHTYPEYVDNILELSVTENAESIIRKLNDFQPDIITGYPSVMGSLARAAREGNLAIHPQAVACSAETLKDSVYRALKSAFNCPVLNNYCSTEGGEAAMSCSEGKLHINDDWVLIEPVYKDGRPVPEGEWSEGVLITDLTNYVQPIIRYYLSDRVRIVSKKCECGSTLPIMEIMGRCNDNLVVGGKELFGINIEYLLMYVDGVYCIQLVQKNDRAFEIRMVPSEEEKKKEVFDKAKDILLSYFSENDCGPVKIAWSDKPPIHSQRGGKVKFIVKEEEA